MSKKYWIYKGQKIPVKKYYPETKKTSEQLYRQLVRKVGQANKRLRSIKNEFGSLGWAGENLKNKTEMNLIRAWSSKGIRVKKDMTLEQMKAISKALDNFLESKTSTVKGIKATMKKQQQGLKQTLQEQDIEITPTESQTLYKFFEDKDFNYITRFIGASDLYALLQDAKENADTEDQFIKRIEQYIFIGEDEDMRDSLRSMYNKYVRS